MVFKIKFDTAELKRAVSKSNVAAGKGIQSGLKDVKDSWVAEAVNIAPVQDGHLRESIKGKVNNWTLEVGVKASDLTSASGKTFNYAYYIHDDKGVAVTGEKKFLDTAAQAKLGEWSSTMEKSLEKELKKVGW